MDPAGIFATSPGWRIVAPSTPFDYIGLMNAALTLKDPVLVIEHVDLYASSGLAPVDDLDYQIPFGKTAVRRSGNDLTVRSEEHTSELQSLMRISYAAFSLKKKKQ